MTVQPDLATAFAFANRESIRLIRVSILDSDEWRHSTDLIKSKQYLSELFKKPLNFTFREVMNSQNVKKAYKCSVEGCQRISSEAGIIFHRLPAVQHIREQWIEKCNLTKVRKNTFICSTHFTKEDYLPTRNYERRRLKKIAVPSLLMVKKKSRFIPNVLKKGGDKTFSKSVEKTAQAEQKSEVNAELKTISNSVQIIDEIVFIDCDETKYSVNNNLTKHKYLNLQQKD